MGSPRPTAKASEAQEPEPPPQKQADDDADGATDRGHGPTTNPKKRALGPEAATARTRAIERDTDPTNEAGREREPEKPARAATAHPQAS